MADRPVRPVWPTMPCILYFLFFFQIDAFDTLEGKWGSTEYDFYVGNAGEFHFHDLVCFTYPKLKGSKNKYN